MKSWANIAVEHVPGIILTRRGVALSTKSGGIRRLAKRLTWKGYQDLAVSRGRYVRMSRAMLEAFVGPPPSSRHVAMHMNNVRDDDRIENLAWGTPQENSDQMIREGRTRKSKMLTDGMAEEIRSSTDTNKCLAARFGVHQSYISHIRAGRKLPRRGSSNH